jgi:tRNA (guanosine-2'-O-)-methyltransferase
LSAPEAVDRRALARGQGVKSQRWPRTARRQSRVAAVLALRQPDLTVVLENIHDPHNVSAVLRTCDAVGVLRAHAVYTIEQPPPGVFSRETSAGAAKWVDIEQHESIHDCYARLRQGGFRILATALGPDARDLFAWDLCEPVALVFGNEMRGVSDEARALADGEIAIPMVGMVQSLNVSVACAVCLYEAYRQRRLGGAYDAPKIDESLRHGLIEEWLRR